MSPLRRLGALSAALVLVRCGGAPFVAFDGGSDAPVDAPLLGHLVPDGDAPDAAQDALEELAQVDAEQDAPAEASSDAGSDVAQLLDAAAGDGSDGAVLEGGDICPGIGLCGGLCSCDAGYTGQWHVWEPDGSTAYVCGTGGAPTNPTCPTGWKCMGYTPQNVLKTVTCP